ncbi:hypothetical protein BGX27_003151, partial [Mortierella sp. AM989]
MYTKSAPTTLKSLYKRAIARMTIKLFCIIDGDSTAFSVKIEPEDTVDDLKDAIKKKQSPLFDHIRASELNLWSVDVADDGIPVNLINVESKTLLTKSTNEISEVFGTTPPKKTIHVIVQRPLAVVLPALKRDREQELEASQKFQKYLGATSISDTRIFQTIADDNIARHGEQKLELPLNLPNFKEWRALAGTIFADKTPYIEELERETHYRYIFLRPRRFGKSAFLNMLCAYYDIHNAGIFDELFGPLYVGKNSTLSKNTHLVLKFDLSSIDIRSIDKMEATFNKYTNH